ncbi:MAG: gamma-glutamyl-gamma-aminobutyrate hydrolase family protein [Anaerolinea sp.]|nr:gamma-glutamyl-gamma-aminobutyrate hydrolase family protein [Anaerolinea sp.]MCC6972408.1 gamma-glutamyl-gamma-aminobutyrate hydrolase family protein [Anaerolineae bacterium]
MNPLIGIPSFYDTSAPESMPPRFGMSRPYIGALEAAGALPVILPLALEISTLRSLYERLDGLFMAGGGDLDPVLYSQAKYTKTGGIDNLRDQTEITLLRWALDDHKPILGVCRGSQILNVASGGTLIQDVADMIPQAIRHQYYPEKPREWVAHQVETVEGSRLAEILGGVARVNSFHHQAVGEVAPSLRACAYAPDGVIEAIEHPEREFVVAVQWHPESLVTTDAAMFGLFESFVSVSGRLMKQPRPTRRTA